MTQVLIIGGGLSGLFCACLTSMKELQTTVVSSGRGGLSISHGAIELFNRASPSRAIANLAPPHPYALAGKENLIAGIKRFLEFTNSMNLHYEGGRSSNRGFLTATGAERHAAYLPTSFDPNKSSSANTSVGAFTNLRDFKPFYAANLRSSRKNHNLNVSILPLLHPFTKRDLYPTDVARSFDDLDWTAENARAWKPLLIGSQSLGLPAVLGLRNHSEVLSVIEEILSIPVFEIPTLPPSIPGLRLEHALREFATNRGARFIEGPTVRGRVQKKKQRAQVVGALLEAAGRQTIIDSQVTILATGSFLHGGLTATQDHRVYEAVFNIPVSAEPDRSQWVQASIFAEQNYSKMGVAVDTAMHPLDVNSEILYENLYAVGGILRGADRTYEGSRQGIDIATAHCAVDHLQRYIN